jgi:hypothetical protein
MVYADRQSSTPLGHHHTCGKIGQGAVR